MLHNFGEKWVQITSKGDILGKLTNVDFVTVPHLAYLEV